MGTSLAWRLHAAALKATHAHQTYTRAHEQKLMPPVRQATCGGRMQRGGDNGSAGGVAAATSAATSGQACMGTARRSRHWVLQSFGAHQGHVPSCQPPMHAARVTCLRRR